MESTEPIRCQVTLAHENGLHLRPIKELVQLASQFACDISIGFNNKVASAKSVLELMTLGCTHGSELTVEARGNDANAAISAVSRVLQGNEA